MPDWRNEIRTCDCGGRFAPKRENQRHCFGAMSRRGQETTQEKRGEDPEPYPGSEKREHGPQ
jgi:hypothetical protein